jgi:hypothetical protein
MIIGCGQIGKGLSVCKHSEPEKRPQHVCTRTIVRYEREHRLTPIRLSSRAIRYDDREIEKLIEAATAGGCL